MMQEHFHAALEQLDVALVRKMAAHIWPHLPQPKDEAAALVSIHIARTEMGTMPLKARAYSHAWLLERGYESKLPDNLRPKAQRMYPVTVGVVGIACGGTSEVSRKVAPIIRGAMSDAVLESYADGHQHQPKIVHGRMMEARTKTIRKLFG